MKSPWEDEIDIMWEPLRIFVQMSHGLGFRV